MRVKEMVAPIIRVGVDTSVSEVARLMQVKDTASVLVEDAAGPVGMITERDMLRKVVAEGLDPSKKVAKDIMSTRLVSVDIDDTIDHATYTMDINRIRRVLVTDRSAIVGKVTARRVAKNVRYMLAKKMTSKFNSTAVPGSY